MEGVFQSLQLYLMKPHVRTQDVSLMIADGLDETEDRASSKQLAPGNHSVGYYTGAGLHLALKANWV